MREEEKRDKMIREQTMWVTVTSRVQLAKGFIVTVIYHV